MRSDAEMRVLIVRLSSMGDVVQTLPAIEDAARALPGVRFDWVVEEAFSEIPAWHASVDRVIVTSLRRWRRERIGALRSGEVRELTRELRGRRYDAVVDLQGTIKSAVIARTGRGRRSGHDRRSVHEWGAQLAYDRRYRVPKGRHSTERMRLLLAGALGYEADLSRVEYGVDASRLGEPGVDLPSDFVVFVHATSWNAKNWPEHYWRELASKVSAAGLTVVLPWGSEDERLRAENIAGATGIVLPQLSISQKAAILARARGVVGLDTGLTHIAAALGVPQVSLYGATDPRLVGALGQNQITLETSFECRFCHQKKCDYTGEAEFRPACFVEITPEKVWGELERLL